VGVEVVFGVVMEGDVVMFELEYFVGCFVVHDFDGVMCWIFV